MSKTPKASNKNEALDADLQALTEALQRERADAINIRRQHEEQIASLRTVVKANVVRDLLPVIDNFDRALKHVPKDLEDNDYIKGIQGVVKQFEKTLSDLGVERIATVDQPFDPRYHEAITMEEGEGTQEIVSEELQSGYKIGEDVIRHAMVRVKLVQNVFMSEFYPYPPMPELPGEFRQRLNAVAIKAGNLIDRIFVSENGVVSMPSGNYAFGVAQKVDVAEPPASDFYSIRVQF